VRYADAVRVRKTQGALTVHAIVGTHVALFGIDLPKAAIEELMGFAIRRTNHDNDKSFYLQNALLFKANDHGKASNHSSLQNPLQEFLWGDYTLLPEHSYTYRVVARYGEPGKLRNGDSVEFDVSTESEEDDLHAVFFNRGVAGSQRYAIRFKNKKPSEAGPEAYQWLSRGLEEGMSKFIRQADEPTKGLRGAVYEFTYHPIVHEFRAALQTRRRRGDRLRLREEQGELPGRGQHGLDRSRTADGTGHEANQHQDRPQQVRRLARERPAD
jgi:hypothetical protein